MPFASVNGQKIFYEDTGGNKPAVVFSHGLLMDHEMFAPQMRVLADRYRVISWDERGHGKTGDAAAAFSYYDSADDLAALLKHLSIRQAVLAGMSQGGYLSLRCALTHPEIVRALILIDTQAHTEDPAKLGDYTQLIQGWVQGGLSDQIATIIEQIILGEDFSDAGYWKAKWKKVSAANLMQIFNTLVTRDEIQDKIGKIKVPTLVIHGEKDNAIPVTHAQDMTQRIAGATIAVIPGAGHAANLTHPDEVNPLIEKFLAGLK